MHYTVIPMGTSKINSSPSKVNSSQVNVSQLFLGRFVPEALSNIRPVYKQQEYYLLLYNIHPYCIQQLQKNCNAFVHTTTLLLKFVNTETQTAGPQSTRRGVWGCSP